MNTNLIAKGFWKRAALLALAFWVLHLFGLREYMSFLSGTYVSPGDLSRLSAFLGIMYLLSYLSFVILVPILVIAGSLLWLYNRITMAIRKSP